MTEGDHVATAPHELRATLWYPGTLAPYWALSGALLGPPFEGSTELEIPIRRDGGVDIFEFEIYYQQGAIEPASRFDLETDSMYEWRIKGRGPEREKLSFHVRPRFAGMNISTPWEDVWGDLEADPHADPEGIDVDINSSNIEPDAVPKHFRTVVNAICEEASQRFNGAHLDPRHIDGEHSSISQFERYVRLTRNYAQTLTHEGGYFWRLMYLLGSEKGRKVTYKVDNEEVVGYNHRLNYPAGTARQLPGQRLGKQLKHYHPQHPRKQQTDDPLYHPKFAALFKKGQAPNNDSITLNQHGVVWNDRDELTQELEETVINCLEHAGVPTDAEVAFVPDDHFQARTSERSIALHPDPTPEIEAEQESVIVRTFRELSEADMDVLEEIADNGETHYQRVADGSGRDISTIYRALDELDGILENSNGLIRFRSRKVAEEIRDVLRTTEQHLDAAFKATAGLLDLDERLLEKMSGAMQKWLSRYAADVVDDASGEVRIKIESVLSRYRSSSSPWAPEVIDEALDAWIGSGGNEREFRNATVEFATPGGGYETTKAKALLDDLYAREQARIIH
jgi:hypothetical protein